MAGAGNITGPNTDVAWTQVDGDPPASMAPYGGYGMPESFGGVPSTVAFAPDLSPTPSPQPGFMSDIDASADRVQQSLVGPARQAAERQSWADRQFQDNSTADIQRQEDAWSRERARADDPALRPWNADQERAARTRGPMEQFGSIGMIFAMAASAFTRTPMTSALNAGAAAMTAIQQGDEKAYESAYKAWKDNSDLALRRFDMEHRLYEDANKLMTTDMSLWAQKTQEIAAQFDHQKTLAMLERGMYPQVLEAQASMARSRLELVKSKEGMEEIKWRGDMIKDGLQALQQDPTWKDKSPEQQSVAKAQVYARAVQASKGVQQVREPTVDQQQYDLLKQKYGNDPDKLSEKWGEFKRGQRPQPGEKVSGPAELANRTKKYETDPDSPTFGKHKESYDRAAKEVKEANRSVLTEGQQQKIADKQRTVDSVVNQVDRARQLIREAIDNKDSVVGVRGAYGRIKEFVVGGDTRQAEFEDLIRTIQREVKPLLSGTTRMSKEDQKIMDTIVPGLGFMRNQDQVDAGLEQLQKILNKVDLVSPEGGLKKGDIEDGYQFKGGDAGDPANWEPVK